MLHELCSILLLQSYCYEYSDHSVRMYIEDYPARSSVFFLFFFAGKMCCCRWAFIECFRHNYTNVCTYKLFLLVIRLCFLFMQGLRPNIRTFSLHSIETNQWLCAGFDCISSTVNTRIEWTNQPEALLHLNHVYLQLNSQRLADINKIILMNMRMKINHYGWNGGRIFYYNSIAQ